MSPQERGRRGNALRGGGTCLPNGGNANIAQRDSGYLAVPSFSEAVGPTMSRPCEMELGFGQTTEDGAYANQRLNLTKLGRPKEDRPGLRTVPGKSGRTGLSGDLRKRSHGGIVNPPRNRKSEDGNPPPSAGAPEFYPNHSKLAQFGGKGTACGEATSGKVPKGVPENGMASIYEDSCVQILVLQVWHSTVPRRSIHSTACAEAITQA